MSLRLNIFALLRKLFLFFCFFPFIELFPLGTDSQPYALIISLLLFPNIVNRNINRSTLFLFIICISACLLLLISDINFNSIRSLSNYVSLFFISYASYSILKHSNGLNYNFYRKVIWVWFVVGLIQTMFFPNFLTFMLPRGDSTITLASGRGVIGLAPEPTFYGIICSFFLLLGYLNFSTQSDIKKYYFLLLIQICFFARSSLVILLFSICLVLYLFVSFCTSRKSLVKGLGIIILIVIIVFVIAKIYSNEIEQLRVVRIFTLILNNPIEVIQLDASVNERLAHLYFPLYGFLKDWGIPHGYSVFNDFMEESFSNSKLNFWLSDYTMNNRISRIMSGLGCIFFELGFIGFLLLYVIIFNMNNILANPLKIIVVVIVIALLSNAVSFAMAIVPFFIGNLMYLHENAVTKVIK